MAVFLTLVVEDIVHELILKKILREHEKNIELNIFRKRGYGDIKKHIKAYNNAAANLHPYLILTDLDQHACPAALRSKWLNFKQNPYLIFRVAVREAEAWLLADRRNFAAFMGVSPAKLSRTPEALMDPKATIVQIAKESRKRAIREALVPRGHAKVGPQYNSTMGKFIINHWDFQAAMTHSPSLKKLITSIKTL